MLDAIETDVILVCANEMEDVWESALHAIRIKCPQGRVILIGPDFDYDLIQQALTSRSNRIVVEGEDPR